MTMFAALLLVLLAQQPAPQTQRGDVFDTNNQPVPGAVVTVKGTLQMAVTDAQGHFAIPVTGPSPVLVLTMPGFESQEITVTRATIDQSLAITLELATVFYQVIVRAPVAEAPPDDRFVLRPLDVVKTAGTQADVMRALSGLPGVVQVDEGAGLFVRGGDVSETRVFLDGTVINHPYRYETPTGGFRGAVDPFLTQGISFATGGFSAEHGNSLSGVVDLYGLARPKAPHVTVTAGLAGLAAQVSDPIGTMGGIRVAANRTTPGLLFAVNPSPQPFDQLPGGWDVAAGAYLDTRTHGSFHVFAIDQSDHVGVQLEQDAFVGFLHSSTGHRVISTGWTRPLSSTWDISAAAGTDAYANRTDAGVFALDLRDFEHSARADLGGRLGSWTIRMGGDTEITRSNATGEVPTRGGDLGGVSGTRLFDVTHRDWRTGGYLEVTHAFGRITPTVGVREDYFALARTASVDPRVNVTVDFGSAGRLRLAWGVYHQAASPAYFNLVDGPLMLAPMAATHYIVGFETGKIDGSAYVRIEAYAKTYRHLPVQDDLLGFADTGYGWAHGVDVFMRRVWHHVDVRASVSWLATERRWTSPNQDQRYRLPGGTWAPDFAVPYSAQMMANVPLARAVTLATTWRAAAGRPFTPVLDAVQTASGFEPIWGPLNSERLPRYARFDVSLSYLRTFGDKTSAVFFLSVDNVTNRQNVFSYAYSADYRTRRPVPGVAPRSFYIGCSLTR